MSKIHIYTNFHENSSKIDCFLGKNIQKTSVANLYDGDFTMDYTGEMLMSVLAELYTNHGQTKI